MNTWNEDANERDGPLGTQGAVPGSLACMVDPDEFASESGNRGDAAAVLRELQTGYFRRIEADLHDLKEYFGKAADGLLTVEWEISVMDLLMAQRALAAVLPEWKLEREECYGPFVPELPKQFAVETAPDQFDFALREGRQFWAGPDGRMTIDIEVWETRKGEESSLTFTLPAARHGWLSRLLPKLRRWMDENHFMRGQAFDATGNFLRQKTAATWDDVVLEPGLREQIERNTVRLLAHRELYRANGIPLKRGMILHGPPGTGKTLLGRVLAACSGATFITASPGQLEDAKAVRRVFSWARRFAPSILFFEDFDMVAGKRHETYNKEVLGEFLNCLDGVVAAEGIITIATTNDLKVIEPALKDRPNRFDVVLHIPPLRRAQRVEFLRRWVEQRGGEVDLERWAAATRGYTGAQMQETCRRAVLAAVEEHLAAAGTDAQQNVKLPLHDRHFAAALEKMPKVEKAPIGFQSEPDRE